MDGYFRDDDPGAAPDVNTTPLIDVLLVLLVMLIVTVPIPLHSLETALPPDGAAAAARAPVRLDIDADGGLRWDGTMLDGPAGLDQSLAQLAARPTPPALHLYPAAQTSYGRTMAVMAAIHRHGLHDVGVFGGR